MGLIIALLVFVGLAAVIWVADWSSVAERRSSGTTSRPRGSPRKAADMADREIEGLGDQAVNNEERARRKRRLIQGPREFRDIRADLSKTKR